MEITRESPGLTSGNTLITELRSRCGLSDVELLAQRIFYWSAGVPHYVRHTLQQVLEKACDLTTPAAISLALSGPVRNAITSDAQLRQLPLLDSPEARRMYATLLLRWLSNTPFSIFEKAQGKYVIDWISQLAMYVNRGTVDNTYEVVPPYNLAYLVDRRDDFCDDIVVDLAARLPFPTLLADK